MMEWENQGSSSKKQVDKMAITRGKIRMVSFLHKLEIRKLFLKPVSFLHKLETETNYAWNDLHAPSMVTQFEVQAPQASVHAPK